MSALPYLCTVFSILLVLAVDANGKPTSHHHSVICMGLLLQLVYFNVESRILRQNCKFNLTCPLAHVVGSDACRDWNTHV